MVDYVDIYGRSLSDTPPADVLICAYFRGQGWLKSDNEQSKIDAEKALDAWAPEVPEFVP